MPKIISFWNHKGDPLTENYLLEKNNNLNFTFKKKFYYSVLRTLLPISIRQVLQNRYNSSVEIRENFIYDELLNYIKEKPDFNEALKNLYPENNSSAIVLTHDVEEQKGFNFIPKVLELEKKYGFKSSWNIVPYKYKIDNKVIELILEAGGEIGIHGYDHDGKLYYSQKVFNERAKFINEAIKKYDAAGFRSPQVHRNLDWLQKLNIQYDASCFDYDPYQPFPGGTGSIWPFIAGKFVELPYTLPQDHTLFYVLKVKNIDIWINKINWLLKNRGMILIITHPDYLINKDNFKKYEEFLIFLKNLENSWCCLPKEMAEWWKNLSV